jgi:hypothetical protein
MVGQKGPVPFEKVKQIGHLLEVGRHVGVVAPEVNIIELEVDDMFYPVAEIATLRRRGISGRDESRRCREERGNQENSFHFGVSSDGLGARRRAAPRACYSRRITKLGQACCGLMTIADVDAPMSRLSWASSAG